MKKYRLISVFLALAALILIVYYPVRHYGFLMFDDQVYVTDNQWVRSGLTWEGVKWAFGSLEAGFWHPATWLSLMLDAALYKGNAGGFHWTNVLLHTGSTLLLLLALYRMTGAWWRSSFIAALFAVHPLNVEPVSWIASRKDMLCGFFWMATLWTYARYAESPGLKRYCHVLICFALGMMSKPMLLTMPFVLLLLDYWPLKRFRFNGGLRSNGAFLILEKMPLIMGTAVITVATFVAERRFGAIADTETISIASRISNAFVSYALYAGKSFLPVHLAAYYPHPGIWPLWISIGAGMLILLATFVAVRRLKAYPYLFVGWFWYLITLLPVIGFVQIGTFARADRYAYIPIIGLFVALTWGTACWGETKQRQTILRCCAVLLLAGLALASRFQVAHWQNEKTLFRHALNVTEGNYKAYHGLGMAYHGSGDAERAIENIRRSLSLKPDPRAYIDLGVVYMAQMKFSEAENEFRAAVKLKPDNAVAHNNLGAALASQGKDDEAVKEFREALRLDPGYDNAGSNLNKLVFPDISRKKPSADPL